MLPISLAGIPASRQISLFIGARTIVFDLTIEVNKIIQLIRDSEVQEFFFPEWHVVKGSRWI